MQSSPVAMLSVRGLKKSFGTVAVIDGLDVDVQPGEVLGVLGPNGAGKTTFFNLIGGELSPDAGTVVFDGRTLRQEPAFKRCRLGMGRTYQIPRPYVGMSAFENLLVAAIFGGGLSEREARIRCEELLDRCGLAAKANVPSGRLTLLDRKRLELARALASAPRLLLLDEIAGGLTDEETDQVVGLVASLKQTGIAVIWIEHVLRALMAVADRVMVLHGGQKLVEGAPREVMQHPQVRRVYMGDES